MSHNITLSNVRIKNLDTLKQAVNTLSKGTARLDKEGKTFRTFAGQPNKCDAVIRMPGQHDIGLVKQDDGSYTPVYDPYAMSMIFSALHASGPVAPISRLVQEYTLMEAEIEAAQNGFTTHRVEGEKGVVSLVAEAL